MLFNIQFYTKITEKKKQQIQKHFYTWVDVSCFSKEISSDAEQDI